MCWPVSVPKLSGNGIIPNGRPWLASGPDVLLCKVEQSTRKWLSNRLKYYALARQLHADFKLSLWFGVLNDSHSHSPSSVGRLPPKYVLHNYQYHNASNFLTYWFGLTLGILCRWDHQILHQWLRANPAVGRRPISSFQHLPYDEKLRRLGLHFLNWRHPVVGLTVATTTINGGLDLDLRLVVVPPQRTSLTCHHFNVLLIAFTLVCANNEVYMYLMIGKGQITPKRRYWGENKLMGKIMGKYKYLVVFWKLADPVPMLLQVVNGSST